MANPLRTCLIALTFTACGGATPSATAPPQPADAPIIAPPGVVARDSPPPAEPNYDLTPVSAPAEVFLHVRWKSPGTTVATLASFTKLPSTFVQANLGLAVQSILRDELHDVVDASAMADVISLDTPVDAIMAVELGSKQIDPEPISAFAVGLVSLARAKRAVRGTPREVMPGMWQIDDGEHHYGWRCVIAAAAGPAPARLVCGDNLKQVVTLAPYLARSVSTQADPSSDLRVAIKLRGLLDRHGDKLKKEAQGIVPEAKRKKTGDPKVDKVLVEAAEALAKEAGLVLDDADELHFDIGFDSSNGVSVAGRATFVGKSSFSVETLVGDAKLSGPAPALMWHLPKSSRVAYFHRGIDPKRWTPIFDRARVVAEHALAKDRFAGPADRRALAKLLRLPFAGHSAGVGASGHWVSRVASKGAPPPSAIADIVEEVLGWHITGIDEPAGEMRTWFKEAVRVYNRPAVRAWMKKEAGSHAELPKLREVRAPRELGRGALAIEMSVKAPDPTPGSMVVPPSSSPSAPPKPRMVQVKFFLLMMEDGGRTWVGMSSRKDDLVKLMVTLKGEKPGPTSLAQRTDLSQLNAGHHGGAFTSLTAMLDVFRPAVGLFMGFAPSSITHPAGKIIQHMNNMPNRGNTPIFTFTDKQNGLRPSIEFRTTIPKGTLDDIGWLTTRIVEVVEGALQKSP